MKTRRTPQSPLAVWLDANGITMREFGRRIGINHSKLSGIIDGRALPGLIVAYEIDRLTQGEVPMESWLGVHIAKEAMGGLRTQQPREYQAESFRSPEKAGDNAKRDDDGDGEEVEFAEEA